MEQRATTGDVAADVMGVLELALRVDLRVVGRSVAIASRNDFCLDFFGTDMMVSEGGFRR